jgi:hypothetical protein
MRKISTMHQAFSRYCSGYQPYLPGIVKSEKAKQEGVLIQEPKDSGYPIGYWAFLRDPDGHTLELSYGQEIGLTVEQSP